MDFEKILKTKRITPYLIIVVFFSILEIIFTFYFCRIITFTDSIAYISMGNFLLNGSMPHDLAYFQLNRLLRPLGIIFSLVLLPLVNNLTDAFLLENSLFFILSSVLAYFISKELFDDENVALISSILFASSHIVLLYGLTVLTDLGSYFFILLEVYLTIIFFKKQADVKLAILIGLVAGFGILMKENTVVGVIFFTLMLLWNKNIQNKLKYLLTYGISCAIPVIINSIIIYWFYDFTYLTWFRSNINYGMNQGALSSGLLPYLSEITFCFNRAFNMALIFTLIGLYYCFVNKKNFDTFIILVISSLPIIYIWPWIDPRFSFVLFLVLIPATAYGIKMYCDNFKDLLKPYGATLIGLLIVASYVFLNMRLRFDYYGLWDHTFMYLIYTSLSCIVLLAIYRLYRHITKKDVDL